jgi:hypothetical protein
LFVQHNAELKRSNTRPLSGRGSIVDPQAAVELRGAASICLLWLSWLAV